MNYNVDPLVFHTIEHPVWLRDGRFWYRDAAADGETFRLVDPARRTAAPAFDHARIAAALNQAIRSGRLSLPVVATLEPGKLPIQDLAFADGDQALLLTISGRHVRCDLRLKEPCGPGDEVAAARPNEPWELSPDGKSAAFLRGNNLWLQDIASGRQTQLTTDGQPDFGYATDNAGWRRSANPLLVWSPDSKRIATFQLDLRRVGRMGLVSTSAAHPAIDVWRYPLAGDTEIATLQRVVVETKGAKVVRLKMPADLHRGTLCDDISCTEGHGWDDVQWSADSTRIVFVSTSRDHKQEWVRSADASSGQVRDLFSETSPTFLESGVTELTGDPRVCWRFLSHTNEVLWYSQRDDWGQLYLYDATTGKLKRQVTEGAGNVTDVLHVDEATRTVYLTAVGKQAEWNPYFAALYRVGLDDGSIRLLTPEPANHVVEASRDGRFFLDVASSPSDPQVSRIRDTDGREILALPPQDITRLKQIGWVPPQQITVKARDGSTDLYGLLFKPTSPDTAAHYPIVVSVYPGPQTGSCGVRTFAAAHRDMQALAELGFAVVCVDGLGTPLRSRSFHEAHFGDLADNTIPDQIAAVRQLAARYPWIDGDRVGIYGHSGGGAAAAAAMFHFPDFFKVGISESGNHDNRLYEDDWAEKWLGLLVTHPDGTTNYDSQANQNAARNLKGHLLLMHGTLDDNVPPANTLLVAGALMDANKDFDLLLIPNAHHGYGAYAPYVARRRWDYFVRYLLGGVPPAEYTMKKTPEP
ncbi:MAG: S9 family peptidase [Acidobacteriota bacterium]|nr:S9 family peptidase [Acidobacteriota bacterium]